MQSKCDGLQAGDLHMTHDIFLGDLCRFTIAISRKETSFTRARRSDYSLLGF